MGYLWNFFFFFLKAILDLNKDIAQKDILCLKSIYILKTLKIKFFLSKFLKKGKISHKFKGNKEHAKLQCPLKSKHRYKNVQNSSKISISKTVGLISYLVY